MLGSWRAGEIETVIASPGVYTSGTNHFAHADVPGGEARAAEYTGGPTRDLADQAKQADLASVPVEADAADVARAIVRVIAMPFGTRPLRITIDPADGGAEEIKKIGDRVRTAFLKTAGMGDLLYPGTHR